MPVYRAHWWDKKNFASGFGDSRCEHRINIDNRLTCSFDNKSRAKPLQLPHIDELGVKHSISEGLKAWIFMLATLLSCGFYKHLPLLYEAFIF